MFSVVTNAKGRERRNFTNRIRDQGENAVGTTLTKEPDCSSFPRLWRPVYWGRGSCSLWLPGRAGWPKQQTMETMWLEKGLDRVEDLPRDTDR